MDLDTMKQQVRGQMPDVVAGLRTKARANVADAPRREAGYSIQNAAGDEAVIRIYDEIWWLGVNAQDFTADLDTITAPSIRVEINSPGGDVFDGIAIYNALRTHPANITTRVDGIAASIASVIAQAGDHRIMVASSQMMIHNAWGMTVGDHGDHQDMAALLEMQDEIIAGIYATASGKDPAGFLALMNAETWMTAERAVAEGLADEVLTPAEKPKDTLVEQIKNATTAVQDVMNSAEQLVAAHAGAGAPLTGAKRDGLVALRAAAVRADGLLSDGSPVDPPAHADPDVVARLFALTIHDAEVSAALPTKFLS